MYNKDKFKGFIYNILYFVENNNIFTYKKQLSSTTSKYLNVCLFYVRSRRDFELFE